MEMIVCPNCAKLTGYKRALGFGTVFMVLITLGFWLLALPFYPKRCITCGLTKSASVPWHQTWKIVALFGFLVLILLAILRPSSPEQRAQLIPSDASAPRVASTRFTPAAPTTPPARSGMWAEIDKESKRCKTHSQLQAEWADRRALLVQANCYSALGYPRPNTDACRDIFSSVAMADQAQDHQEDEERNAKNCEAAGTPLEATQTGPEPSVTEHLRSGSQPTPPNDAHLANTDSSDTAPARIDTSQQDQIWGTVQAWAHSIETADIDQLRTFYGDHLDQYYGNVGLSPSDVVQSMASKIRDYSTLKLKISNPTFSQVAPNLVQVDYDKQYEFTGPNARSNKGETKSSLRLVSTSGKWVIVAEFDRRVCWSTLMKNPLLQSPPGRCQ